MLTIDWLFASLTLVGRIQVLVNAALERPCMELRELKSVWLGLGCGGE